MTKLFCNCNYLIEGCVWLCNYIYIYIYMGRDSSVGIATRYGLDGPGIESRWGEVFRNRPDLPWGLPNLLHNGYRVFPGGKSAEAWRLPPTHLATRLRKEQRDTSTPFLGLRGLL
jgi:hypothetical protein